MFVLALIVRTTLALYARTLNDWFQSDALLLLSGAKDLTLHVYVRRGSDFREFQPLRPGLALRPQWGREPLDFILCRHGFG